jgi:hypothetical protein
VQQEGMDSQNSSVSPDNGKEGVCHRPFGRKHDGAVMAKADNKRKRIGLPRKTYWHLYSLQSLQADKLTKIVNKILKKEYVLIK